MVASTIATSGTADTPAGLFVAAPSEWPSVRGAQGAPEVMNGPGRDVRPLVRSGATLRKDIEQIC